MEIEYNSTNPYNFTFALDRRDEEFGYGILTDPYDPYRDIDWQIFSFLFRSLKNVRFHFMKQREVIRRLSNVSDIRSDERNQHILTFQAIRYGVIDTVELFFFMDPDDPKTLHLSSIIYAGSHLIVSSVRSDARRESSETLSFQGLSTLVWVLVGFSLLVVSGLVTYFSFRTEKKENGRERPLNTWMNNVWIYAADIVSNCVAGVVRQGPGRTLRSWWLLGIVFLLQFWVAGMKSDLLVDKPTFIDSLEDLLSRPELILVMKKQYENSNTFGEAENDPRFKDYERKKIRYVNSKHEEEWRSRLVNGSGVILEQEISAMTYFTNRIEKLKEAKRKQYNGKKRYDHRFTYTVFNKRLPRAIKEDIDYVISRIFETVLIEPRSRGKKFRSREFIIDATVDSASTTFWSAQNVTFLSPVFRLWLIGMSLATIAFCVEYYQLRRSRFKVSPHHSMGIRIRA